MNPWCVGVNAWNCQAIPFHRYPRKAWFTKEITNISGPLWHYRVLQFKFWELIQPICEVRIWFIKPHCGWPHGWHPLAPSSSAWLYCVAGGGWGSVGPNCGGCSRNAATGWCLAKFRYIWSYESYVLYMFSLLYIVMLYTVFDVDIFGGT